MTFLISLQKTDFRPTDKPTDGPTDGPTDRASYRDARSHLKKECDIEKKANDYNVWHGGIYPITHTIYINGIKKKVVIKKHKTRKRAHYGR